ncbi:MAG: hypothetical protein JNK93_17530 [Planctomycetia bacterium]|nr:hypothetical protein [Planctomycetia bacterium]
MAAVISGENTMEWPTLKEVAPVGSVIIAVFSLIYATWQGKDSRRSQRIQNLYDVIQKLLDIRPKIEIVLKLDPDKHTTWTEEERTAASDVCSRFHLVGMLIIEKAIDPVLFARAWYHSVPQCYRILTPYLQEKRRLTDQRYWSAFDVLATMVETVDREWKGFQKFSPEEIESLKRRANRFSTFKKRFWHFE